MSNNILKDKFNRTLSTTPNDVDDEKAKKQTFIPFDKLVQSKDSRKIFLVDDSYKDSINEDGLLTPFLVNRLNDGKYEILSGNKRYEAFKTLVKNKDFKYKYMGNNLLDPMIDGIPCIIVERPLNETEKTLMIIEANKSRDFDKLEIYKMVTKAKELYDALKKDGHIQHGDGREVKWLADRVPVSERTISTILSNQWLINDSNYQNVTKLGTFEKYCEIEAGNQQVVKGVNDRVVKDNPFNKEYKYLDKIDDHHKKLDFDKLNLKESEYDDLRENAKLTIKSIMNAYSVSISELK